jgi:hypothetical protein
VRNFKDLISSIQRIEKSTLNTKNGPLSDLTNLLNVQVPAPKIEVKEKEVKAREFDFGSIDEDLALQIALEESLKSEAKKDGGGKPKKP